MSDTTLPKALPDAQGKELYSYWRTIDRESKIQAELMLFSSNQADYLVYQQRLLKDYVTYPSRLKDWHEPEKVQFLNNLNTCLRSSLYLSPLGRVHGLLLKHLLENDPYQYKVNQELLQQAIEANRLTPDELSLLALQMTEEQRISLGTKYISKLENKSADLSKEAKERLAALIPHCREAEKENLTELLVQKLQAYDLQADNVRLYGRSYFINSLTTLALKTSEARRPRMEQLFLRYARDKDIGVQRAAVLGLITLVPQASEQRRMELITAIIKSNESFVRKVALIGLLALIPLCNQEQCAVLRDIFLQKLENESDETVREASAVLSAVLAQDTEFYITGLMHTFFEQLASGVEREYKKALLGLMALIPHCNQQQKISLMNLFIEHLDIEKYQQANSKAACLGLTALIPKVRWTPVQRSLILETLMEWAQTNYSPVLEALRGLIALAEQCDEQQISLITEVFIKKLSVNGNQQEYHAGLRALIPWCNEAKRLHIEKTLMDYLKTHDDSDRRHAMSTLTTLAEYSTEPQRTSLVTSFSQILKKDNDPYVHDEAIIGLALLAPQCTEAQRPQLIKTFINEIKSTLNILTRKNAIAGLVACLNHCSDSQIVEIFTSIDPLFFEFPEFTNILSRLSLSVTQSDDNTLIKSLKDLIEQIPEPKNFLSKLSFELTREVFV